MNIRDQLKIGNNLLFAGKGGVRKICRLKKAILVGSLLLFSPLAFALYVQQGIAPGYVGSENNGSDIFIGLPSNPYGCAVSTVVFYSSNGGEKNALAIALSAKASGKTIRLDYYPPRSSDGICVGFNIYLE